LNELEEKSATLEKGVTRELGPLEERERFGCTGGATEAFLLSEMSLEILSPSNERNKKKKRKKKKNTHQPSNLFLVVQQKSGALFQQEL